LDLVLSKIPTKELYKLQISVMHEVQSRARTYAMNLETTKEVKEILEISLNQVQLERDEEKQRMEKIEQRLEEVFKTIPDNAQAEELSTEEKIQKIVQAMESYRQEITDLEEKVIPSTPPEIKAQREQQVVEYTENIEGEINIMEELYNSTTQMWTELQEDEKIQELDQKEGNINTAVQDLKHRQKIWLY
jgi:oligoendopeptidase F